MTAILSATEHDFYAMPLPLVVWSWKQLGIDCKVFIPEDFGPKLSLAMLYCEADTDFYTFQCEKEKEATYAQVSRLFGGFLPDIKSDDDLITGDADLAVFSSFFKQLENGCINVVGSDLLEDSMKQYPMCFVSMPAFDWIGTMDTTEFGFDSYQEALDFYLKPLQSNNPRGDFWSYDQWLIYKNLQERNEKIIHHPRAALPNRWATRRADRDGWNFVPNEIIDAHLPRPLTEQDNWDKVMKLFTDIYPDADKTWMWEYREKYLLL